MAGAFGSDVQTEKYLWPTFSWMQRRCELVLQLMTPSLMCQGSGTHTRKKACWFGTGVYSKPIAYAANLELLAGGDGDGSRANTPGPDRLNATCTGQSPSQIAGRVAHCPEQSVPMGPTGHGSSTHPEPLFPASPALPPSAELASPLEPPAPPLLDPPTALPPAALPPAAAPPLPQSHSLQRSSSPQDWPPLQAAGPTQTRVSPELHCAVTVSSPEEPPFESPDCNAPPIAPPPALATPPVPAEASGKLAF